MTEVEDLKEPVGVWYWGVPGAGKSYLARQRFPKAYLKMANKWWDGYQQQENVILDEIEKDCKLGHHLKIWTDSYGFIAEIKGEAVKIRPKNFVITSNYSIEEVFGEDMMLVTALKRRFKVVHFPTPYKINGSPVVCAICMKSFSDCECRKNVCCKFRYSERGCDCDLVE